LSRRSPLDSSNDWPVGRARCGQGYEPVPAPQTINQSMFPRAQHLLRQREKIPECPNQIRALQEIRLYISRTDRRVQFKNAIGEFFNPHDWAHLEGTQLRLCFQNAHYCTRGGALGSNLFILRTNYFAAWISLRGST
jgi:hypothetical protein